jgi:cell division protein FtsZ
VSITGGTDLTLFEVDEAANRIREQADPDANIIVGATFDDSLEGVVRVSVVATGIDNAAAAHQLQGREAVLTEVAAMQRSEDIRIAGPVRGVSPRPTPTLRAREQADLSISAAGSIAPAPAATVRTPRMPRIDELPLPAQNLLRARR